MEKKVTLDELDDLISEIEGMKEDKRSPPSSANVRNDILNNNRILARPTKDLPLTPFSDYSQWFVCCPSLLSHSSSNGILFHRSRRLNCKNSN